MDHPALAVPRSRAAARAPQRGLLLRSAAAALAALLLASGCAGALAGVKRAWRSPGERLLDLPAAVVQEYGCERRQLPFLALEHAELVPTRVKPGGEFNHRMIYALCPVDTTEVVRGTLVTRIRFKGRELVAERTPGYELKPGRWVVDAFVQLPPTAEEGIYALELEFQGPVRILQSLTFAVERS